MSTFAHSILPERFHRAGFLFGLLLVVIGCASIADNLPFIEINESINLVRNNLLITIGIYVVALLLLSCFQYLLSKQDAKKTIELKSPNIKKLYWEIGIKEFEHGSYKDVIMHVENKSAGTIKMEYIILESNGYTNAYSFQKDVNDKIEEGWKPIGGLSVIPLIDKYNEGLKFYQAMCKE